MKALTKKQKVVLLHIRLNPRISFRALAKVIDRGIGAVQTHVLALHRKGYLKATTKNDAKEFMLVE